MMKVVSVADAQSVVDREDDVVVIGQILVDRVGVGVVPHVMPAKQHLAGRATVHEDDARLLGWAVARAREGLSVYLDAVPRPEYDGAGGHQVGHGEWQRDGLFTER